MDTETKPTLDLSVCGNLLILHTDYRSLKKSQEALFHALERVRAELIYLQNQPLSEDVIVDICGISDARQDILQEYRDNVRSTKFDDDK